MSDPAWLAIARRDEGLLEIAGAQTAPRIRQWLADLGAWWRDDETPWCGVAVAAWMQAAGLERPKHWYRAKGWLDWGVPLEYAVLGAVVVFERKGGGHVGLCVGYDDAKGALMVLGGNQGNKVSVLPFDPARVLGYRWPPIAPPSDTPLPLMASNIDFSNNEA
jgi:uncharacterized protein (TIGR02594 family)